MREDEESSLLSFAHRVVEPQTSPAFLFRFAPLADFVPAEGLPFVAFRSLAVRLLATLWAESAFSGRLRVKLPCDWRILSPLNSSNARSCPETERAICAGSA